MSYVLVATLGLTDQGPDLWDHEVCDGTRAKHIGARLQKGAEDAGVKDARTIAVPLRTANDILIGLYCPTGAAEEGW